MLPNSTLQSSKCEPQTPDRDRCAEGEYESSVVVVPTARSHSLSRSQEEDKEEHAARIEQSLRTETSFDAARTEKSSNAAMTEKSSNAAKTGKICNSARTEKSSNAATTEKSSNSKMAPTCGTDVPPTTEVDNPQLCTVKP